MPRMISLLAVLVFLCGLTCTACAKPSAPEIIDPAEAAKDPDFKIQGEYVGEEMRANGDKVGAQMIALGNGQFAVWVTKGGLPGNGWKRGEPRYFLTVPAGLKLNQIMRHSPTEGAKPPAGAVVLFDGTTADNFIDGTMSKDKNLMSNATSKRKFGDYTLHVEFRLSYMPLARGQARSNSGVYLHDCYEIQVLDSFGLEGENNECGGFYAIRKPDVNMCYPPLTWQTYDVDFTAPRYKDGKKVSNARVTVRQNGVVIHPDFELPHATAGREPEGPAPRPLYLQGHGNKVEYRNIWVKERSPEQSGLKAIFLRVSHATEHLGHSTSGPAQVHHVWIDGCRGRLADTGEEFVLWWNVNEKKEIHSQFKDGKAYKIAFRGELEDGVMGYKGKCLHIAKVVNIEGMDR